MNKSHNTFFLFIVLSVSLCYSDFRSEEQIAPGVIYYHDYRSSGPWHLHVLEIDLSNPLVELESVKAANSLFAREKTSLMSGKMNWDNHTIAGAINADFFEWNGQPVGVQVINGLLINIPTTRSIFGMTEDKEPFIGIVDYKGQLFVNKTISVQIDGLNRIKKSNELMLYNSYYKADTLSYTGGLIIRAKLLSDSFCLNDTMEFQISEIEKVNEMVLQFKKIRENEILLIGPKEDLMDLELEGIIRIRQNLFPIKARLNQAVGGLPRLIRDGNPSIEWRNEKIRESFSTKRHPRTAVGFTKDKKKIFLFVLDGRQPGYSVGMTLPELARYMLEWGVHQGVNLDGGGSSTMVVQGEVSNSPSDPNGERPVANALMVVNMSSKNDTAHIDIYPDRVEISSGATYQFNVHEQDVTFHLNSKSLKLATWFCDPNLGTVDTTGLFTAGELTGIGYIYVEVDGKKDSSNVSIIHNHE